MTRLAIIGNSHVGAIKRAWDVAPRPEGIELAFFALPQIHLRQFRLNRKLLRFAAGPDASAREDFMRMVTQVNGAPSIDLGGFDAVMLYGGTTLQAEIVRLMNDYDIDGLRAAGAPRRMSRPAFDAVLAGLAEISLPRPFWRGTRIPRFAVFPRPIPSAGATTSDSPHFSGWARIAARPDGAREIFDLHFAAMAAAHARKGIDFLRQPAATLEPNGLTNAIFTKGSTRLRANRPHPATDFGHMNARYGALCLERIFDWAARPALAPA